MDPDQQPWQIRLANLFQNSLTPPEIQARDPLWKSTDAGFYSQDSNVMARARSYDDPEMQSGRQELILAAGANAGIIIEGNDSNPDKAYVLTYADTISNQAQYINLQTQGVNNLLWNSTPFNPRYNTYFQLPLPWRVAEDAYQFANGTLPDIGDLQDIAADAGIDLTSITPMGLYAALTPQKVPLMNGFMAACLQLIIPFLDSTFLNTKTGLPTAHPVEPICPAFITDTGPVYYSPPFLALAAFAMMDLDTEYQASITAADIGTQVKQLATLSIPGVGFALGAL